MRLPKPIHLTRILGWVFIFQGWAGAVQPAGIEVQPRPPAPLATPHLIPFPPQAGINATSVSPEGLIFVGSGKGIYSYDGQTWLSHFDDEVRVVYALDASRSGRIYYGAYNTFGYIEERPGNPSRLVKLSDLLPKEYRHQIVFLQAKVLGNEAFFTSPHLVIRHDEENGLTVWEMAGTYPRLFAYEDEVYIIDGAVGGGLYRVDETGLTLVPDTGVKRLPDTIDASVPWRGKILFMTRDDRFQIFDGQAIHPLPEPVSHTFDPKRSFYKMLRIANDRILAIQDDHSLIVLSPDLKVERRIASDDIDTLRLSTGLSVDPRGGVWIDGTTALVRFNFDAPIDLFDQRHGLSGTPSNLFQIDQSVYIVVRNETYRLVRHNDNRYRVEYVPGAGRLIGQLNGWLIYEKLDEVEHLFYRKDHESPERKLAAHPKMGWLTSPPDNPNVAYGFGQGELYRLRLENNRIKVEARLPVGFKIHQRLIHDHDGNVWSTGGFGKIIRISSDFSNPDIKVYGAEEGLPDSWINPFLIDGDIILASRDGVYSYDQSTNTFKPAPQFNILPDRAPVEFRNMLEIENGNVVALTEKGGGLFIRQPDGSYEWRSQGWGIFSNRSLSYLKKFASSDHIWGWGDDGLIRIHSEKMKAHLHKNRSRPVLRRIENLGDGTVLHEGFTPKDVDLALDYQDRQIRLIYSGTQHLPTSRLPFQLRWDDGEWSEWTYRNELSLTRKKEGHHRLEIRTGEEGMALGQPLGLNLRIQPPLARTVPAYFLYAAVLATLIFMASGLRSRHLKKKNEKLEAMVAERNQELMAKRDELEKQNSQILAQTKPLEDSNQRLKELDA